MPTVERACPVVRVTDGPFYHFFGYYDKCPWDAAGRNLLCMRVAFMHRPPGPEDMAIIGTVDLQDGNRWSPLAETTAWNWQQGTHLQWLGSAPDRLVIFNTRERDHYVAVILDVHTGERQVLPRPIYAVSADGRQAVTLNFSRVACTRPGYGYVGVPDAWAEDPAPAEDGIYHMDLATGASRLVISLAQMAQFQREASMEGAEHWFNHLQFNPSGTRFIFLHRWRGPGIRGWHTRLFTASPDGSDIAFLGREHLVSHFDWRDDDHVLAWSRHNGEDHFHLYRDRSDEVEVVGRDVLLQDGHCSYSPDRRWLLDDTYPDPARSERTLILYHLESNTRFDVGHFYAAPDISGEIRCDLHPRWNRDGTQVCFDSIHEGERQVYCMDVSGVLGSEAKLV
ncbi:MAG: hypothetical protein HPY83_00370 [Anaerolineae bacterium]|nr:hypothetical protein [Anaerolineae bacterium]